MLECLYYFSNSHDQFYFMEQISSCHRIRQLSTFRSNCICRFAEEKRLFSFRICSHLPTVIHIILTHTIDSMDRETISRAFNIHSWGFLHLEKCSHSSPFKLVIIIFDSLSLYFLELVQSFCFCDECLSILIVAFFPFSTYALLFQQLTIALF